MNRIALAAALSGLLLSSTVYAIGPMEMDDFEDGTTENWQQPAASPGPSNVPDGGPAGAGDNFLLVPSSGTPGPGGRVAVINESQWTGDYNAIGSAFTISLEVANFPPIPVALGDTPLQIRLALESGSVPQGDGESERWVTTSSFPLPRDGVWRQATFTFTEAEMSQVSGTGTLSDTLDNVTQLRIISAEDVSFMGDQVAADLGVDNIQVESVPVELQSFSID